MEDKKPKRGRPVEGNPKSIHTVHLSQDHIATAKKLGGGNVSKGVRVALDDKKD